jgi:hypothetical protein
MKQMTTDDTDFTDRSLPAASFTISQNIRVIREICGLLQSAKQVRVLK